MKPDAPAAGPTWHVTAGHGVTLSWGRSDRSIWVPSRCGCACKPLSSKGKTGAHVHRYTGAPPSLLLLPLKLMKPCYTTFSCTSPNTLFESLSLQISKGHLVMALCTQLWVSLIGQGLGQRDREVFVSLSHRDPMRNYFHELHWTLSQHRSTKSIEFNARHFLGEAPWRSESLVKLLLHPSGTSRHQWRLQAELPVMGSTWCFRKAWLLHAGVQTFEAPSIETPFPISSPKIPSSLASLFLHARVLQSFKQSTNVLRLLQCSEELNSRPGPPA